MGSKCSIIGCTTGYGYATEDFSPSVHTFPSGKEKLSQWLDAIPNQSITTKSITQNMGICSRHWPSSSKFVYSHGKLIPDEPPSINFVSCDSFYSTLDFDQKLKYKLEEAQIRDLF